jgi:quercetin dioxygenase-like cupin family protein
MSERKETNPDQSNEMPESRWTKGIEFEPAKDSLAFPHAWFSRNDLPSFRAAPGVTMQSAVGGALMANWVTIEPNRPVPLHQHLHEQLGIMLEGAMELTIGDEVRVLRPGDAYSVPPHLPHSARTLDEGCVVLDIFTPIREDYVALAKKATAGQ